MPWFVVEIGTIQREAYRDMKLNVDDMPRTRTDTPGISGVPIQIKRVHLI